MKRCVSRRKTRFLAPQQQCAILPSRVRNLSRVSPDPSPDCVSDVATTTRACSAAKKSGTDTSKAEPKTPSGQDSTSSPSASYRPLQENSNYSTTAEIFIR